MTIYELIHFKKMVRVWKNQITIILFKIWPTNRFLKAKPCHFHFHKNDVTWPLSANGLLWNYNRFRAVLHAVDSLKYELWSKKVKQYTYSVSCRYFQAIFLGLPLENRVFLFTWIKVEEWSHHWMALTASRLRRCWEEKTTRSNWMKFRLK